MNTNYNTISITVKGNIFSVTIASGLNNYISVRKETNNPYKTLGKEFANFDAAQQHYKCADMKVELLKLEMGLN